MLHIAKWGSNPFTLRAVRRGLETVTPPPCPYSTVGLGGPFLTGVGLFAPGPAHGDVAGHPDRRR
jgi:hypothetical protein